MIGIAEFILLKELHFVKAVNAISAFSLQKKQNKPMKSVADWRSFAFTGKIFVSLLHPTRNASRHFVFRRRSFLQWPIHLFPCVLDFRQICR